MRSPVTASPALAAVTAGILLAIAASSPDARAQAATGVPASELRIATIDSISLDRSYIVLVRHREEIQSKKAIIDAAAKGKATEAQPMADRVRAIQAELNDPISDEAKREKVAEYQSLVQQLQVKDQEIKKFASDEYKKLSETGQARKNELLTRVREVIAKLCDEKGIDLVLENSSLEGRAQTVWFARPEMDLTNEVLAILNAGEVIPPSTGEATDPVVPDPDVSATPIPAVPIEP